MVNVLVSLTPEEVALLDKVQDHLKTNNNAAALKWALRWATRPTQVNLPKMETTGVMGDKMPAVMLGIGL